jgi:hypothetical protein
MSAPSVEAIFQAKYEEFADALKGAFPELIDAIDAALLFSMDQRWTKYRETVLTMAGRPDRNPAECPGMVLPGVVITPALWSQASKAAQDAINQYLSIMTFSFVIKEGEGAMDLSGNTFKAWADDFMNKWRTKLDRTDFDSFAKRLMDMFGKDGERLPPFPERLRNGKLAKLAEDIVRELRPEEFGFDEATVKLCEADPSKAFEILMETTLKHPERLQTAMKRIVKRLQEKFQRGEFRPEDLKNEAEEMMKEFAENPAFVEMMEMMRSTFGFEDMETARAAGQEQSARLALVKNRLRKKLEAKKNAKK